MFAFIGRHAPAVKRFVPAGQRTAAAALLYRRLPTSGRAAVLARQFRRAARNCEEHGSPLNASLLRIAAADVEARGPCWTVVEGVERANGAPRAGTAGSLMAAVHRVVLETPGTPLERHFPSTGGRPGTGLEEALLAVVDEHAPRIAELAQRPVQTNEIARCRALIGGFLLVGTRTGLPLRLLELGASAGLNLRWDHYRYVDGEAAWGDPASPVLLAADSGAPPPLDLDATVAERRGCDLRPIDPRTREGQLSLLAHVWPDQPERHARLRAAFEVAAQVDAQIDEAEASAWLTDVLAEPAPGRATVVFDTAVMEYLDDAGRERVRTVIAEAGRRATPDAPVAWLHPVPPADGGHGILELVTWPGGRREQLARLDPHARSVRWCGPGAHSVAGSPNSSNSVAPNVGIPAIFPSPTRSTSSLRARNSVSP
jgi:hypothetical protein